MATKCEAKITNMNLGIACRVRCGYPDNDCLQTRISNGVEKQEEDESFVGQCVQEDMEEIEIWGPEQE